MLRYRYSVFTWMLMHLYPLMMSSTMSRMVSIGTKSSSSSSSRGIKPFASPSSCSQHKKS